VAFLRLAPTVRIDAQSPALNNEACMFRKMVVVLGLPVLLLFFLSDFYGQAVAQNAGIPLGRNDSRITSTFSVHPGWRDFRFAVQLDKAGKVAGVSVFREGDSSPFQTLPTCAGPGLLEPVTEGWTNDDLSKLIKHDDLNFDGFEDLELLQYFNRHSDKKLYCIYLWNDRTGRFLYSKDLTDIAMNVEAHPETKTLTVQDDWQGGAFEDSTYRWKAGKLQLIEQHGLYGDWSTQSKGKCGFEFRCGRLRNGEMVTTLIKPVCTVDEMQDLPNCPGEATFLEPKLPAGTPAPIKRN